MTDEDKAEITRLFGYVPEPEPLEEMLRAVERIANRYKAEGWANSIEAIFWCRENGSDDWASIIDYVAKNNPHEDK